MKGRLSELRVLNQIYDKYRRRATLRSGRFNVPLPDIPYSSPTLRGLYARNRTGGLYITVLYIVILYP